MFESITNKLEGNRDDFINDIMVGVNYIFENSLIYDTNVMGALLDVVLNQRKLFQFPSDVIAKVSLNSGLLSSGALILEEYLISNNFNSDEPVAKQSRGYSDNAEIECWAKLAE